MADTQDILSIVDEHMNPERFREQHWEGSFHQYLEMVIANPSLARDAFQRIYDMIMHFGSERYTWMREEFMRYSFFSDPIDQGLDAIYGLDKALMNLVDFFKSASYQLRHGAPHPAAARAGRLLEEHHCPPAEEGAGVLLAPGRGSDCIPSAGRLPDEDGTVILAECRCPMHEEPLKLIPLEARPKPCSPSLMKACMKGTRSAGRGRSRSLLPAGCSRSCLIAV